MVILRKSPERSQNAIDGRLMKGEGFSLSLDEYTSKRNRPYVNINVHAFDGVIWCLGMVRAYGSLRAQDTVDLVTKKMNEFGLNFGKHIFACVTDGASVMIKFGKLSPFEYQLCFSHGIHLAVCDVL